MPRKYFVDFLMPPGQRRRRDADGQYHAVKTTTTTHDDEEDWQDTHGDDNRFAANVH